MPGKTSGLRKEKEKNVNENSSIGIPEKIICSDKTDRNIFLECSFRPRQRREWQCRKGLCSTFVARLLCPWESPGKNTWSELLFPAPGNLPVPGIEPVFRIGATREALNT